MVASYDFTRQAELRRWIPPSVQCTLPFTEEVSSQDNLELVSRLSRPGLLERPARRLAEEGAEVVAYLCTACSFWDGWAGELA